MIVVCLNDSKNVSVQRCVLYIPESLMIGSGNELCSIDAVRHWLGKPRTDTHLTIFQAGC